MCYNIMHMFSYDLTSFFTYDVINVSSYTIQHDVTRDNEYSNISTHVRYRKLINNTHNNINLINRDRSILRYILYVILI